MIGEKITPILVEIENTLWEFEAYKGSKPEYPIEGFRAAIKIFTSALTDKIFELQEDEAIDLPNRLKMAQKAGEDVRALVKTYTDIDCHDLW